MRKRVLQDVDFFSKVARPSVPVFKTKNEKFFKKWSPEMAYVLGFFTADGNLTINPRGSRYIEFTSCDRDLIEKMKNVLAANHKISIHKRTSKSRPYYRLQIGSKEIFNDLMELGMSVNKSKTVQFPDVPKKYLSHFVRGYFDGDGNVTISNYYRNDRKSHYGRTVLAGFVSGSRKFLVGLRNHLCQYASMGHGTLYFSSRGYRLFYSVNDSKKLHDFMYRYASKNLWLQRKKEKFEMY